MICKYEWIIFDVVTYHNSIMFIYFICDSRQTSIVYVFHSFIIIISPSFLYHIIELFDKTTVLD